MGRKNGGLDMKYYKLDGFVYAFEGDGSQDEFIPPGAVKMTDDEVAVHIDASVPSLTKAQLLNSITVTTQAGKTFDGNETARNNMMSAIMAAEVVNQSTSEWKLADNSIATVDVGELKEALTLSIQAAGQIYLNS